ncbi:hypothetical protein PV325_001806 [Microctonus aethiopoides]|uniref:FZ domain-containing protein n=1 Tax=Microctonus aethiopoides TaxID=144406 RepID=A0AA39FNE7_9HYME|nr:hypothetical protein PV325_001806 [Microctonus aethiopoides]KAK0097531.1 hypothetical protein PV326_001236 [Microctonus aethiopoides]KAK0172641.1 hypothetical protein PV328_005937 [Microctonus aethiopoides]
MAINSSTFGFFGITTLFFISIVTIINATEPEVLDIVGYSDKCEPLVLQMCASLMPYNTTMMPNYFGTETQSDASLSSIHQFAPLPRLDERCRPHLAYYLCLLHAPVCTKSGKLLLPCRSLCHDAQDECQDYLAEQVGSGRWPKEYRCEELPDHEAFPDVHCIGNPKTKLSWSLPPPKVKAQKKNGLKHN